MMLPCCPRWHGHEDTNIDSDFGATFGALVLAAYASTLPLLANAQGLLPVGDQPLPGGLEYPQDSIRRFPI